MSSRPASPVRLIALDIDGTLLGSNGRIPEANIDTIHRALAAGVEIVLATGRRFDFARPIFEQLPGPLTLILSNGALIKSDRGETLQRHLLPREVARDILAAVPEHRSAAALLFDRPRAGQIVYERIDWDHPQHRAFFRANEPFIAVVDPLEDALTEEPLQLMFTGTCADMRALYGRLREPGSRGARPPAPSTRAAAADVTQGCAAGQPVAAVADVMPEADSVPGDPYAVALTEYLPRDFSLVDIIRAGCSKGAALREWAGRRGIPPGAVMAVGDNLNDLQMLEFAGHPVVMENGLEELKTRGWKITASNDAAGVAQAIREILPG